MIQKIKNFMASNAKFGKIFSISLAGSVLFLLLPSFAWASAACDIATDPGCASLWSVKSAARVSSFNYIWIMYLCCAILSMMLLFSALTALKQSSESAGSQNSNARKPAVLIVLAGCLMSVPFLGKVMVHGVFGYGPDGSTHLEPVDDMEYPIPYHAQDIGGGGNPQSEDLFDVRSGAPD